MYIMTIVCIYRPSKDKHLCVLVFNNVVFVQFLFWTFPYIMVIQKQTNKRKQTQIKKTTAWFTEKYRADTNTLIKQTCVRSTA